MKTFLRISIFGVLFFGNSSGFSQQHKLDLSAPEQKKDFLQFMQSSISLLSDNSFKEMMKGYDLKNFTDSNKFDVVKKIMNDSTYSNRLMSHFSFMQKLEKKYRISNFSSNEWAEVARLGAENGIYFTDAMKKVMGQQGKALGAPDFFPKIPKVKVVDSIPFPLFP
jgi:hypothetical protein